MIEKNIDRKLANIISYQKRYSKGKFGRGGPNLRRGIHIRWRIWTGESKSAGGPNLL